MKFIILIFGIGLSPPLHWKLILKSWLYTSMPLLTPWTKTTHKKAAIVASCLEQNSNLQI